MKKIAIHLRLELETKKEKEEWKKIKAILGTKANTDTLRALIKKVARGEIV